MLQEGTEDGRQSWLSLENTVCPTDLPSGVAKPKVPTGTWSWVCFPSLPRSCAPPVFLTLAQVLQVISPAPQEHPKDSRMNSPFQMWKLERAPGLTARAVCCRGKMGAWAQGLRSWLLGCSLPHLLWAEAGHPHDPLIPLHYFPWPMCPLQSSLGSPISSLGLHPGPGTLSPLLRAGGRIEISLWSPSHAVSSSVPCLSSCVEALWSSHFLTVSCYVLPKAPLRWWQVARPMIHGKPAVAVCRPPCPHAGLTSGDKDRSCFLMHPLACRGTHLLNEWTNEWMDKILEVKPVCLPRELSCCHISNRSFQLGPDLPLPPSRLEILDLVELPPSPPLLVSPFLTPIAVPTWAQCSHTLVEWKSPCSLDSNSLHLFLRHA